MTKPSLLAAAAVFLLAATPSAHATEDLTSTHGADTVAVGNIHLFNRRALETPPNARNAGGFLSIYNYAEDDRLISGSSPVAERVELHTMTMDGDVMRMRPLPDGIEVPNETQVNLEPGGLHIMFIGLEEPFVVGDEIPLTLTFEVNGSRDFTLPVRARRADSADHSGHGSHN